MPPIRDAKTAERVPALARLGAVGRPGALGFGGRRGAADGVPGRERAQVGQGAVGEGGCEEGGVGEGDGQDVASVACVRRWGVSGGSQRENGNASEEMVIRGLIRSHLSSLDCPAWRRHRLLARDSASTGSESQSPA